MPWIDIKAADFGRAIEEQLREDTGLARRVALEVALRGVSRAVTLTNKAGKVDRGQFKRSWKAIPTPDGAELLNDAPYAGVIEHGRRPGRPGPPLAPIYEWVQRKLRGQIKAQFRVVRALSLASALDAADKDASSTSERRLFRREARAGVRKQFGQGDRAVDAAALAMAMSIRDKIHARGTKPSFILRQTAWHLGGDLQDAATRQLRRKHGG